MTRSLTEIVSGIHTWSWFSEDKGYNFNGHFVRHAEGNLAIDPVEVPKPVMKALVSRGVSRILLTNRNHSRDSMALKEATGAKILIHAGDAAAAGAEGALIEGDLVHGARIGPFTVVPAAGKSSGEIALHWPERRILVVGDVCVGNPPGEVSLLPDRVMDDPGELRRSLRRIVAEVDFDTLLVGDGASLLKGAKAAVSRLLTRLEDDVT
jgi:glyoxylase-like metal-dependent hydrolase (beta-lactamase superfamily II)